MAFVGPDNSSSLPPFAMAAEGRAREFLAQGKWRKARDELKPLLKVDRARYLPLLIQANLGLVREMAAKGMHAEARQVMTYLATIAPAEQLRAVELELAGGGGSQDQGLVAEGIDALGSTGASLSETDQMRLVDQLVLAFAPAGAQASGHAELEGELHAVQTALQAVGEQRWEQAIGALRPISHRSAFRHWAAFVKGLVAFHHRDWARARRFFKDLPPISVPAKAAKAHLISMPSEEAPGGDPSADRAKEGSGKGSVAEDAAALAGLNPRLAEATIDRVCRVLGEPMAGRWLLNADRLWRAERHVDSYRSMRNGLPAFPGPSGWLGAVSEFYFQAPNTMAFEKKDDFLDDLGDLLDTGKVKSPFEHLQLSRMHALADRPEAGCLEADWERFLELHEEVYGPNPRLASIGYAWLGEQLSAVWGGAMPADLVAGRVRLRNAVGARDSLLKAIELDPENLKAHLVLSLVYRAMNRRSERNRLLDQMAKRFPQEKLVLMENAACCLERKTYNKALRSLESARQLDRLDPGIPHLMLTALWGLARQQFEKGNPKGGRETLKRAEEWLNDRPGDWHQGRWPALVRCGVLEDLFGDPASGRSLLEQARAASPVPSGYLFFAHLCTRAYQPKPSFERTPFLEDLGRTLGQEPSAAQGATLLEILGYWNRVPDPPSFRLEESLLQEYLKKAARQPMTLAEARKVIEVANQDTFGPQVRLFIQNALRQDSKHPWFRLARYLQNHSDEPFDDWQNPKKIKELEAILAEAGRRGDEEVARKVQGLIHHLKRPPVSPVPFPDEFDPFGDEEDDFDEDWSDDEDFGPGISDTGLMASLVKKLVGASMAEIQDLRQSLPKEVPKEFFDALVKAAKTGKVPEWPPLPPRPPMPPFPPPLPRPGPKGRKRQDRGSDNTPEFPF